MKSLLTTVIPVTSIAAATEQVNKLNEAVDVVELRLDYLPEVVIADIKKLLDIITIPYILTLRSKQQGGKFAESEDLRIELLQELLRLNPAHLDIEADIATDFLNSINKQEFTTKIICSDHDFESTPKDLDAKFALMQHADVDIYKIITTANSSLDSLRMMRWVREKATEYNIVGHCMGELGEISRIAGAIVGNYFIYAANDAKTAVVPNQVTIDDLMNIYRIKQRNYAAKLFALIGDPVDRSVGHIFHNDYFAKNNINALYMKIKITKEELSEFINYCFALPFVGLSVTMPLKQDVLSFVVNESSVQAVNTLKVSEDKIHAINTDGMGALDAIEKFVPVADKKVLVIGAGGSATAIIAEASSRGAKLAITNRTLANAKVLAEKYNASAIAISDANQGVYDVVINTLPNKVYADVVMRKWLSELLQSKPLVMDVNYNQLENHLLNIAQGLELQVVIGEDMFINQAMLQLKYWFK